MVHKFECIYNRVIVGNFYDEDNDEAIYNCSHRALQNILKYVEKNNEKINDKYMFSLEEFNSCCTNCKKIIYFVGIVKKSDNNNTTNKDNTFESRDGTIYELFVDQKIEK